MGRVSRVGILGGTFDPPHVGHLIMAERARQQYDLDSVQWVVAADPPHKDRQALSPINIRVTLVQAAIHGNRHFVLSKLDIDRPGPHYSVDMLALAAEVFTKSEIFFILGSDSLRDLHKWHQPERLVDHATLCVMTRTDSEIDKATLHSISPQLLSKLKLIDGPAVVIASSTIREFVKVGQSIRYLVPDRVAAIIRRRGLYRHSPNVG